jgi:hypothetical protein
MSKINNQKPLEWYEESCSGMMHYKSIKLCKTCKRSYPQQKNIKKQKRSTWFPLPAVLGEDESCDGYIEYIKDK